MCVCWRVHTVHTGFEVGFALKVLWPDTRIQVLTRIQTPKKIPAQFLYDSLRHSLATRALKHTGYLLRPLSNTLAWESMSATANNTFKGRGQQLLVENAEEENQAIQLNG